ncbi:unnamed protein product [Vitrella brassicaformis CCMP3155]|uniref:histone acetyltransferase n=1 Tax=Vitrella brassicaformis (strain CCMP3155) TaxID=1169540 RepID=A0A0G4ECC0_VITBC|nr:unnamed protein product [Vitrella brassicaformis CCMP3155]|eukprot:CEL92990.1 unnamed protein product [Vitrella brassicaformis CCMP3155]
MGRVGRTRSLGANALKSVCFHPCKTPKDYHKPPEPFHPSFAHHIFDTDQAIMDFEELNGSVHIFYIPDTFDVFVKIEGEGASFHACRERVMACLTNATCTNVAFPGGFCPSEHDFVAKLERRVTPDWRFQPPGKPLGGWKLKAGARGEEIQVRRCGFDDDDDEFKSLHRQMEWFLHWFIEGIEEIEQDEKWHVYFAYERPHSHNLRSSGGPGCLSVCGFATTYTKAYTFRSLLRVSQFLIFPHYQRKGVGTDLLEMIYKQALDDPKVKQIGVERPAPAFVQLHDVVTIKLAIDRNLVSPLAFFPPPPGAEVPSSASAAFPASSGLGLTNGLPLDKTRGRTHKLHSALFDAGASGAASSAAAAASASTASGGMSIGSKKRRLSAAPGGTTLQSKKRRLSWGG